MWLSNKFPFLRNPGSEPSTAIIVPKWKGGTGWNYCEGWTKTLTELRVPHRIFYVLDDPREIRKMFSTLKKNPPELILLSSGDHHLFDLHNSEEKQDFWRSLKSKTVCFCGERIINSPFPLSVEKTTSALRAFDGFFYVDEFAGSLFLSSGKPARWTTYFSDDQLFLPRVQYEDRQNQIYFRATLRNDGLAGVYSERRALIEQVKNSSHFVIHDQLLSSQKYAQELATQRFVLRTPSNCPGYVEAFWNPVACGCVVFHQKLPVTEIKSANLLQPDRDFLEYDAAKPADLIERAKDVLKNWPDYKTIAETGRQTFLANYTLKIFLQRLLQFADTEIKGK